MSNHLAIATVTAALKQMLQVGISEDVPGAQVTTVRPDAASGNISGACINLFLYHAMPNTAWRNADLRTRRPEADERQHRHEKNTHGQNDFNKTEGTQFS